MNNKQLIADRLIKSGQKLLEKPLEMKIFVKDNLPANVLCNDHENYPHAFVLASIMDSQINAENAWLIPLRISEIIHGFALNQLLELELLELQKIFREKHLHRFHEIQAKNFYNAVHLIQKKYDNNASNIWNGEPKSGTVVRRFLEFEGVGIKIATMATNILVRDFKIPMQDKNCIDISPDRQVIRVFQRIGLIEPNGTIFQLLYCARELNPEYPGIFDYHAWEIGKNWCKPTNPRCDACWLNDLCPKII